MVYTFFKKPSKNDVSCPDTKFHLSLPSKTIALKGAI